MIESTTPKRSVKKMVSEVGSWYAGLPRCSEMGDNGDEGWDFFCFCFFAKDRAKEPQSSLSVVINIDLVSEVGRSNRTPSEKPDYFVLRSMSRLFNPNDFKSGWKVIRTPQSCVGNGVRSGITVRGKRWMGDTLGWLAQEFDSDAMELLLNVINQIK